jgi:cysteine synthase
MQPKGHMFPVDDCSLACLWAASHAFLPPTSNASSTPSIYVRQVKRGVLYSPVEAEGKRKRNPFDTVTEGVGLNRLTKNFAQAQVDDAVQCSDQEAVYMAHFLLHKEGLWVGSSSAVNCVGAVKVARQLGPGHSVLTILCDGGKRHLSKFYDAAFLESQGLHLPATVPDEGLDWVS